MVQIQVETSLGTKVSRRLTGLSLQESLKNRKYEKRQMTVTPVTGAVSARYEPRYPECRLKRVQTTDPDRRFHIYILYT